MRTLLRALIAILAVLVMAGAVLFLWQGDRIERLGRVNSLFAPDLIVGNFSAMDTMFETAALPRGDGPVTPLPADPRPLPDSFTHAGTTHDLDTWLEEQQATGLVVLVNGAIAHESYRLGTGEADRRISWSVAKSVLSVLLGTVVEAGEIASLDDPVQLYAPSLAGSAYDGVTIRQVANMASGVTFDEDYLDFWSDINHMGRVLALGFSMDGFAARLSERDRPAGEHWQYVSIDTHVLGMVIEGATGRPVADLMPERVIAPLGLEADAYYVTDGHGTAFVLGGLNLTTRDYARFGLMVAQGGVIDGRRIVSEEWIALSTRASAPPPAPGSDEVHGYGLQWWVPRGADAGEVYAVGIYDQFVYIDPAREVVIALNSANRGFRGAGVRDGQIEMFRAIAAHVAD